MPHDKLGRNVCVGDTIRYQTYSGKHRIGVVHDVAPGADRCNLRAVTALVQPAGEVPPYNSAFGLPNAVGRATQFAVFEESGVLTASEVELVARADGKPVTEPDESQLRVFAGFLSAHMPELLDVEVPRLKAAVDDFLAASVAPAAEPA